MSKKVHILNGDSTASILKESNVTGDCIVFRELLCEGPLSIDIGSAHFWNLRIAFFEDELDVNRQDYLNKVVKELTKIEDLSNYGEVILWFEFDLFCQVNLMALCSYLLNHYNNDINYSLICVGKDKKSELLLTLADYSPQEYQQLYQERVKLTHNDLVFAKKCWEKYVTNNLQELKEFNFNENNKFKYLQLAVNQHLKRFSDELSLNQIDLKILETIQNNIYTKKDIVRELLIWQKKETVYGFGDLQHTKYLEKLYSFYKIKEDYYYLNNKGKNIIESTNLKMGV